MKLRFGDNVRDQNGNRGVIIYHGGCFGYAYQVNSATGFSLVNEDGETPSYDGRIWKKTAPEVNTEPEIKIGYLVEWGGEKGRVYDFLKNGIMRVYFGDHLIQFRTSDMKPVKGDVPLKLADVLCSCCNQKIPKKEGRYCAGCNQYWPDYESYHNHHCPQRFL